MVIRTYPKNLLAGTEICPT